MIRVVGLIEVDSDGSVVDRFELPEAVAVIEHKVEDHRRHLAYLYNMLDDIEFDAEYFELLVEEDDSIAEVVESFHLLHVFIEGLEEAIEVRELLGDRIVLGADEEGKLWVGVVEEELDVLWEPVVADELESAQVDLLDTVEDVGGGIVLLSCEERVASDKFIYL